MPGGQSEGTSSIHAKVLEWTACDIVHGKLLSVQYDMLDRKDDLRALYSSSTRIVLSSLWTKFCGGHLEFVLGSTLAMSQSYI